jgi:hypothetical protein
MVYHESPHTHQAGAEYIYKRMLCEGLALPAMYNAQA